MAKIILLNAPKGAGKDTIADEVCAMVKWSRKGSFKAPMFAIAHAILGAENFRRFLEVYDDREQKEKPHDFLMGMNCREFMIWISEDIIKPKFGEQYFGARLAEMASKASTPLIVSDCGFEQEIIALIDAGHEVRLVRMHREGFKFDETDSRNYVYLPACYYGVNGYDEVDTYLEDGNPKETASFIVEYFELNSTNC